MSIFPRKNSSVDTSFMEYVAVAIRDAGVSSPTEAALEQFSQDAVEPFSDMMAKRVAGSVLRDTKTFRINAKMDRGFNKRLKKRWGKAFKMFIVTRACAQEAGEGVLHKSGDKMTGNEKACRGALIELHAKACRVASEVYALLVNGFPEGALARCRTLHEFAVTASILGESLNDPDHGDLAQRFLDHEIVSRLRSAKQYQVDHALLNLPPLEEGLIETLEERYRAMLAKYGEEFKREYGWAKRFCPDDNFRALERKAGMAHMRSYYQWASGEVHSGSFGLSANRSEFRGEQILRVGKTNSGLAEPASMAMNSLYQTTVTLLVRGSGAGGADMADLISMKAIEILLAMTSDEFLAAEAAVQESEEKYIGRSGS